MFLWSTFVECFLIIIDLLSSTRTGLLHYEGHYHSLLARCRRLVSLTPLSILLTLAWYFYFLLIVIISSFWNFSIASIYTFELWYLLHLSNHCTLYWNFFLLYFLVLMISFLIVQFAGTPIRRQYSPPPIQACLLPTPCPPLFWAKLLSIGMWAILRHNCTMILIVLVLWLC